MIRYQQLDGVARITIDDPSRRNPLSNESARELRKAIERAGAEDGIGAIVLTGEGEKAFSAGGDLSGGFIESALPGHQLRGELADLFRSMVGSPRPIVGRINGAALGGGFGIAAACDISIVVDDAKLGTPEIGLGLWPMMISALLSPLVPQKALLNMMMTGEVVTGADAVNLGIATKSVPRELLDPTVDETLRRLLSVSPAALALGKRAFYATQSMDRDTALDNLHIGLTAVSFTDDAREGVSAFLEQREPRWSGR